MDCLHQSRRVSDSTHNVEMLLKFKATKASRFVGTILAALVGVGLLAGCAEEGGSSAIDAEEAIEVERAIEAEETRLHYPKARTDGVSWHVGGWADEVFWVDAPPGDYEVCITASTNDLDHAHAFEVWVGEDGEQRLLAKSVLNREWSATAYLTITTSPTKVTIWAQDTLSWTTMFIDATKSRCPAV